MKLAKTRLSGKERLSLFGDLHTMLAAGIPIMETIESLEPDAKGNLKKVLSELHRALVNGETLGKAMARFPLAFDAVTVNLLRAAESGGTLEETLDDIVKATKDEVAFSSNIKTAMVYPAFVMTLFTAIMIMMLTFVIPRISKVFETMHTKIPWTTRQIIHASDFFLAHWPVIILAVIAAIVSISIIITKNKRFFVRQILNLPLFRRLGLTIDLMRLTRSLALLLKAGEPLEDALILTKRTMQKKEIVGVLERMQSNIQAGKPLATGLRDTKGIVPVMMVRSMETAETSGTLEQTLQTLAEHFNNQVSETMKGLSSILEPIMILVVGLLVGSLMVTVIAPIYNTVSQFKPPGAHK